MICTIQNNHLSVEISSVGAELIAVTGKDGTEYLPPEELKNWDGTAPVLFPNTGWIREGKAFFSGREYPYIQHGFARHSEFEIVSRSSESVTLTLKWSEQTLKIYPFRFRLKITYALNGNVLTVSAEVMNEDPEGLLCYSLGFHPGFSCPIAAGECAEDYRIVFDSPMSADRILLYDAMAASVKKNFWDSVTDIPVREGMFSSGSFSMTNLSAEHAVTLRSSVSGRYVRLEFEQFPNLVLWAPKDKPITNICMEPWYGQADRITGEPDVSQKPFTIVLAPQESRMLSFRMIFG